MTLPAPNLDDRRFQQLVDDAKRLVQQRCPEWTDHNVHDPGVTLIETFAWMTDLLLYRLNRVPDRHYVKFLELLGIELFPPTAARAELTFWLSAPLETTVTIPEGIEVSTLRTDVDSPVTFTVAEALAIPPSRAEHLASQPAGGDLSNHDATVEVDGEYNTDVYPFGSPPAPGDVLLVGLDVPVPRCVVMLELDCDIEGIGVDPKNPPLVWEAWNGSGWTSCDVDSDETGGLNRAGRVVLHVPRTHQVSVIGGQRAAWLRARVVEAVGGQPAYSASPRIRRLHAATIGGDADGVHAVTVHNEVIGLSEGVPGQRFTLQQHPVVPGAPVLLEVATGDGWEEWHEVASFADAGPADRVFTMSPSDGVIQLGPAVRQPDGSVRQYGAVPPKATPLRVRSYRSGGGAEGNVSAHTITALSSNIPFVDRVDNRFAASGGVDGEDIENAKIRGPIQLRTRNRAVTAMDYEVLAREAAPDIARVRSVPASADDPSGVRVLVVPSVADQQYRRLRFEQLVPPVDALQRIATYLDERRTIGARVIVEPPRYQGITIVARVRARPRFETTRLRDDCLTALYGYFHPVSGGPDGTGWPFGRPVHVGEVYSVLQRLPGVEMLEDARLFAADPITGERGQAVQRVEIDASTLLFSYEHQVMVEAS
jgi:predicted phage baseplate assembly protein